LLMKMMILKHVDVLFIWVFYRASRSKCRISPPDWRTLDLLSASHRLDRVNESIMAKFLINSMETKTEAICDERKPVLPAPKSPVARQSFIACLFHQMKKTNQATTYHVKRVFMKIRRATLYVGRFIRLSV
jgi:hypothetical protein